MKEKSRNGKRPIALLLLVALVAFTFLPSSIAQAEGEGGLLSSVYLSGSGNDENDGSDATKAVKTFAKAKALLDPNAEGAKIYVTGLVEFSGNETWTLAGYKDAKIVRANTYTEGILFKVMENATLTLENITIDGGNVQTTGTSPLVRLHNKGGTLIVNDGTVLQNNYSDIGGAVQISNKEATFKMNGGLIRNTYASSAGGGIYANTGKNIVLNGGKIESSSVNTVYLNGTALKASIGGNIEVKGNFTVNAFSTTNKLYITGAPKNNILYTPKGNTAVAEGSVVAVGEGYTLTQSDVEKFVWDGSQQVSAKETMYFALDAEKNQIYLTETAPVPDVPARGDTYTSGSGIEAITVNYYANYGGSVGVDKETGIFTVSAEAPGYVIDTICVDGVPLSGGSDPKGETKVTYAFDPGASGVHSIVAAYAYTLSFNSPANGTLSVSRVGGDAIESGDIVRAGELLNIAATPDSGHEIDEFKLVGLHENEDGTYTVYGLDAPSINVTFKESPQQPPQAQAPTISVHLVGATYEVGDAPSPLTVTASAPDDGGALTYQWYRNTANNNTGGYVITGATSPSYTPPTSAPGTAHYYCVVTNTQGESSAEARSNPAAITVTGDAAPASHTIKIGDDKCSLDVWVNGVQTGTALVRNQSVSAKEGDEIRVTVHVDTGYALTQFSLGYVGGVFTNDGNGNYSFVMPARNLSLIANIYSIKTITALPAEHGTVSTDAGEDFTHGTVRITATPAPGYRVDSVFCSKDGGSNWFPPSIDSNGHYLYVNGSDTAAWLVRAVFVEATDLTINTEAELRAFAAAVNGGDAHTAGATVTLASDIALTAPWTPIGTAASPFKGNFDGAGHRVSGMEISYEVFDANTAYVGFFGYVQDAEIKDLTVEGSIDESASDPEEATTKMSHVGGVAAYADVSRISGCVSMVDIAADYANLGGIAGHISRGSVENCFNYGDLRIRDNNGLNGAGGSDVGGLVGRVSSGSVARGGNHGAITVTGKTAVNEGSYQGVGYRYEDEIARGSAGGVVGNMADLYQDVESEISSCFNRGAVRGRAAGMGGLLGSSGSGDSITVSNSYNTGAVAMTVDNAPGSGESWVSYTAGLVGETSRRGAGMVENLTLTNCYNAGEISSAAAAGRGFTGALWSGDGRTVVTATNCFAAGAVPAAAALGEGFKEDGNRLNGGCPLLVWEDDAVSDETFPVAFNIAPAGAAATVGVYADAARTEANKVAAEPDGSYRLRNGRYYYAVRAEGYVPALGDFGVARKGQTVQVALRASARVVFSLTPANAELTLRTGAGEAVAPESVSDGARGYLLYAGDSYGYTASAEGHNAVTRTIRATDGASFVVKLTPASRGDLYIRGGETISEGGVYNVARKDDPVQGTITVATSDPVTLVGEGLSTAYENLRIRYAAPGADLTLRDIFIRNTDQSDGVADNLIDFKGAGNRLLFEGTSVLDHDMNVTGYAMFHVPADAELTLGGANPDDTLYLYKHEQGACIGGDTGEYNGKITFTQGNLFAKNSKQGALMGAGSGVSKESAGSPGDIRLEGGTLNLIANSRSAALGGGAGHGGAADGTNVYIHKDANLSVYVDFSGAAIGGGGHAEGNDSDGGVLHYLGGSIRVFIDQNAIDPNGAGSLWPDVTEAGVNDAAITAARRDGAGRPVYPLAFDTRLLGESAETFTVLDGDDTIYRGGPHAYGFVNDSLHKDSQISIVHTVDNWAPIDDPNLYLYLTGRDHALTVNDQVFSVSWNGETQTFQILEGSRYKVAIDPAIANGSLRVDRAEAAAGESVTVTVEPAAGRRFVSGSLKADGEPLPTAYGVASFAMPARDVTLTAAFAPLPAQEAQYDVEIAEDIAHGAVTTDVARGFDGQKVTVTATPETGYRLKAGSLKANGTAASLAADGARFFLISGADVTVTAEFESLAVTAPSGSKFKTGAAAKDFVLRIPADFALYDAEEGVTLNGEALPRSAYKAEEGSTVVTIFASHLSALPKGDYAVRVPFTDGSAVERGFSVMDVLVYDIGIGSLSGGFLSADKSKAEAGELVTVTATPQAGFRLVAGSLKWDGRAINTDASGGYAFTMPDWDVTLTAEFIESEAPVEDPLKGSGDVSAWVWDGKSIDLTWFDPEASSYHIKTPAQLAGLAALVNGLYNREIDTIAGDASYIRVNTGLGDENGPQGNNKSTATFHYGAYNFAGKTVYLDNDIDMGDANYMPIGGQYLMTKNKSETHIDASFNGVFDGRGHSVTINVDRHVSTGNYGDGQSVGLIGRLGVHDNDDASLRPEGAAVKNVAVYGSVRANRSVGGVVGKIGKTNGGAVIENCANFAAISSTDAKGVGGIVGAAWNGGSIKNCYNAGTVNGTHTNPAGGVAGSVEIPIENSYSYGRVTAPSGYAMAIGTNNGGAPAPENSYYLAGSAKDGGWYTGASADNAGERTAEYMKSDEFVSLLGGAFVKDTNKINNGYPVLKWQGGEAVAPPPVVEEGAKPSVNVPATTTVKDSEAVTVVEIPDAETPLANGEAVRLVVNVDTKGETVNKVKAELPAEFVKQAKESKSEVEIRSEVANMLLPEKAVAALGAEGKSVEVKAEKNEEAGTYAFTVASGGKSLTSVDGGIKAAIPVKAEEAKPGTVAVLVREDGTEEVIKKSFAKEGTLHAPLAGSATIKIVDNAKSYDDVAESAWYGDAVKFATGHELFKGTGETAFAPDASMTRGMLVTVLHRLEDEPSAAGAEAFGDVGEGKYYAAAVRWAAESGVVTGMGEGIFAPNAEITREQLAVILYRYAGALGLDASAKGEVSAYMDAKDVSPWAEEAMLWAAGAGLIAGRANPVGTELAPKDTATRAEVAAMLERFIENML